jgi:hypothetical protein
MTDETGRRMRGVRDERGADGVRDDIGEALKWRRMRDEKEDVHVY